MFDVCLGLSQASLQYEFSRWTSVHCKIGTQVTAISVPSLYLSLDLDRFRHVMRASSSFSAVRRKHQESLDNLPVFLEAATFRRNETIRFHRHHTFWAHTIIISAILITSKLCSTRTKYRITRREQQYVRHPQMKTGRPEYKEFYHC